MQSYFPSFGWAKDVNFEQFSVDRDRTVPRDLKLSRRDNGFPQSRDLCATIHQCEIIAKLSVARPHNAGFMLTIFATHGNHRLFVFREGGGERLTRKLLVLGVSMIPLGEQKRRIFTPTWQIIANSVWLLRAGTPCQWELYNIIYKHTQGFASKEFL